MTHTDRHDPLMDYHACPVCYQALCRAWVNLTGTAADRIEDKIAALRRELEAGNE